MEHVGKRNSFHSFEWILLCLFYEYVHPIVPRNTIIAIFTTFDIDILFKITKKNVGKLLKYH